jgi:glycosyltransferase involved in cell wall biosynthesis
MSLGALAYWVGLPNARRNDAAMATVEPIPQQKNPLVSVIVPTKNSAQFLARCLQSIKHQTYQNIEIIVIDNHSTDDTQDIAKRFTDQVYTEGPERSAQRNSGAEKAKGEYLAIIDSDMELTVKVIEASVREITKASESVAVIIPEESFGEGFWAQCKALERSFYIGNDDIEAARFLARKTYQDLGGFDTSLVAGEDWDLTQRLRKIGSIARITEFIRHNEGRITLMNTLRKKYYYAQHARVYLEKSQTTSKITANAGPLRRYQLFLSHPTKLFSNPIIGVGVLFLKTCEYTAGGLGYATSRAATKDRRDANQ